ncbi:hypothetical protein ATE35_00490 [Streptococcus oralis subsp. tigurinus]|uniref:Uncharacterized protein n=1 Tax=Streptococcus oralis subsp. tigurinus TaxID=1077464 RepID=A0A1X0WWG5_STROR|nr:hypothetical protein [Streptococcus oralis]ORJ31081.1 hypothetical protein ATE35_00490 [Streptococcus oralis subsp. tigurinus]
MKKNLDSARRDYLDFELQEKYLKIDTLISKRKNHLLQTYTSKGMNASRFEDVRSKSGTYINRFENIALEFASDPIVLRLEEFQKCIDKLLDNLVPDDRKIFELRWGHSKKEWSDIFEIMNGGETGYLYSKQDQILKRRNLILDNLARLLGYYNG